MNIIFAGTPEISATVLQALIAADFSIIACLTQPDRPKGRGQHITPSPVKLCATEHQIPILQPSTLKTSEIQQQLQALRADLMIVLAYGLILPQAVLDIPRLGCINIHASLLPRWRGAAPIQHAILAGDQKTGITIMQMDAGLDTGDILSMYPCAITPDETSASLYQKLSKLAAHAIIDVLRQQKFTRQPQDNALATYAQKISKADAQLNWQKSAIEIDRAIRAYNPAPVAFTQLNGAAIRVWRAAIVADNVASPSTTPGTIIAADRRGIDVVTGAGTIRLLDLQFPGKKIQTVGTLNPTDMGLYPGAIFV